MARLLVTALALGILAVGCAPTGGPPAAEAMPPSEYGDADT